MNRLTTPIVGAVRRLHRWDHQMDPRVAWLSPMPPARSGIATYSQAVLEGLERIGGTPGKHKIEPYWPIRHKHWATVPWHTNRVRVAELGAALALVCGVASKVGLDLELLAQTEVGEVRFAGHGGGSSAMPQKRNPVDAMWARAAGELGRGHASVLIAAPAGEHERAGGAWQAEWDAMSGALAATGGAVAALARGLDGLEVDPARMRANLDVTGGGIVSERLALELTERMGHTAARELARDASARATSEGITLAEALGQVETGLTAAELEALLDPTTYLGA